MTESRPPLIACTLIGLVGGLAAGLLGIGGGLVVVPLLTSFLGVPLKRAIGTSLLVVLVTSVVGVATETIVAPRNVQWRAAVPLAVGAVIGAIVGAHLVARTPPRTLAILLAILMVVSAAKMVGLFHLLGPLPRLATEPSAGLLLAGHLVAGLLAGVLAAMFGIGGGILAVPSLAILHPRWEFQACRATSLVMIIPTSILAATLHRKLANLDVAIAKALAPSAAAGSIAGVLLANAVPGRPLELLFATVLTAAAVKIAWPRRAG